MDLAVTAGREQPRDLGPAGGGQRLLAEDSARAGRLRELAGEPLDGGPVGGGVAARGVAVAYDDHQLEALTLRRRDQVEALGSQPLVAGEQRRLEVRRPRLLEADVDEEPAGVAHISRW